MIKLYKTIQNQLHYWEIWQVDEKTAIVYWGIVGKLGQYKEIKSGIFINLPRTLRSRINTKRKEGYTELDEKQFLYLEIAYKNQTFEKEKDLEKRYNLEERITHILELRSLGHCNSIATKCDSLEIGCIVTDYNLAKKVIDEELKNIEFGDYTIIYKHSCKSNLTKMLLRTQQN
ncbi:hypothetical protein SGQ83_17015 [Flavobacterium sp. Fl-318]|uniref:WGR domain-containing protein n=1 Tax=Flavobacterium cupriresistens TaxID=2893885 RepID=A0ABU4REN4_9FLAO|nr:MULTISPECIES: hypothetical protein [unclassified Flavobacterium]MDX6191059.1 hypothetical protein [Flavobacterium sp. Fl-318]UFH42620.1 hypothetical protein LNP23_22785 [Flavobacterium sp. F-323]